MINFFRLLLLGVIAVPHIALAQQGGEELVDLESIPLSVSQPIQPAVKSVIDLPFYDDFSRGLGYPVASLWDGKHVVVSPQYAINSPNVGVATFDAMDNTGKLHSNASIFPFSSDTLMSRPIKLDFPSDTSVYFSFQFQPQGLGNKPDIKDSLLLEFYNPNEDVWESAWAAWIDFENETLYQSDRFRDRQKLISSNTLNSSFFLVHIPVVQERFLNENFQFRFRNIASVSSNSDVPGLRGNSDHWHIDMVYLNRGRTYKDTLINDIAFSKPLGSILNNYEQIPWLHFNQQAKDAELTSPLSFNITYTNIGQVPWNITRLFSIYNQSDEETYSFSGGAENILSLQTIDYSRFYLYDFNSSWSDSARFTFTSYLVTDINEGTQHLRWNDTLRYTQNFSNFYAYDDGSTESGYGLYGEGTQNGRVAYKFNTYQADNIVGVYMYFNRTFNDANQKYFRLAIWDDNNGTPGNLIYEQVGVRPLFTDSLNRFTLFKLSEELWLDAGTFYVGWIQTTTDMLNVGFDRNNNSRSNLYYNISGNWENSKFDGALMIRPVFGKLTETPTSSPNQSITQSIKIFPNPVRDILNIELPYDVTNAYFAIFNMSGQMVYYEKYTPGPIDLSRIANGTYVLRVVADGRILGTQKLVVIKW
jgi:hypothetical protein